MFLIVKTGSTFADYAETRGDDFEHWTIREMGIPGDNVVVVDAQSEVLPDPKCFAGIVVTGSHSMVSDREPWSEQTASWLKNTVLSGVPVLGICYGHQLLAHALGGVVQNHPQGPEIGTVPVSVTSESASDPIFSQLPETFLAHVTHTQSVIQMPEGAVLLASNDYEPVEAFRYGSCAWGVQFHPEFDVPATRVYTERQRAKLSDPAAVLEAVCATPESHALLRAFVRYCQKPA